MSKREQLRINFDGVTTGRMSAAQPNVSAKPRPATETEVIQSRFGFYRGFSGNCDSPLCWIKRPKMACKYTKLGEAQETVDILDMFGLIDKVDDSVKVVPLKEVQDV